MHTYVALDTAINFPRLPSKKEALLFDKIAFPRWENDDVSVMGIDQGDWGFLQANGVVHDLLLRYSKPDLGSGWCFVPGQDASAVYVPREMTPWGQAYEGPPGLLRHVAANLWHHYKMHAVPLLTPDQFVLSGQGTKVGDVAEVVLRALPVPEESTSWEQIIDFRKDRESLESVARLRHWMTKVTQANLQPAEIGQELEYLLSEYQQHLRLHRIKCVAGVLETVVTIGAEIIEGIIKLSASRIVKALFSIAHRRISLLEAERSAPGREVAYVAEVRNRLASK